MLDHATGYLMAFGAMMAKARQAREGGSWHVRVSLARTGQWLWNLGRVADGLATEDLKGDAVRPFVEEVSSGFGPLRSVSHSAVLSKTPGVLGAPGDAARQSPAAMAGAALRSGGRPQKLNAKRRIPIAFFGCLQHQLGTISVPMRQSLLESPPV